MTTLLGDGSPVELGNGVVLRAPGLVGEATLHQAQLGGTRGEAATTSWIDALADNDFRQLHAIEVEAQEVPVTSGEDSRSDTGEPGMEVSVPGVGEGLGQALMAVDEQGVVTWHFPAPDRAQSPGTDTFLVSRVVAAGDEVEATEAGSRGIASLIGTKLLQVLVYPLVDKAIGKVADRAAKALETRTRPYGLRLMTPTGFATKGADPLDGAAWDRIRGGRALLFLHGTNSSSHSAFGGLDPEAFGRLHAAYGGRVFAFDHHTLADDLKQNVAELLQRLPPGSRTEVDVISHSRGGLVARAVAEATRPPDAPLSVRRIVHVATPNGGTPLADPQHLRDYLNRVTTMLNLIPDGPWSVVTDSLAHVLELVRLVGSAVIGGLPGLEVMDPKGSVVRELGWPEQLGTQFTVSVDFEPTGRLMQWVRAPDGLVDSVFASVANDLVVPTDGVSEITGRPDFAVPPENRLLLGRGPTAWHCSLFTVPRVQEQLEAWLTPGLTPGPAGG